MAKMIFSLLPTQYDSLDELHKRRNALLTGTTIDGIMIDRNDPDVQTVLKALSAAIQKRRNQPKKFAFKGPKVDRSDCGKTKKDKAKENYRSSDEKKKAKSEESRKIRQEMQSSKKK